MRYRANAVVRLKDGVKDPQGQTIREAARSLGFQGLGEIRAGKQFALEIEAKNEAAVRSLLDRLCHKLLANPVIETYAFEILKPKSLSTKGKR
jgi:phosphoribosylformylglycinamidine synthase PurS subunit